MDGERLLPLVSEYRSAVLSWVGPDGFPASARCHATWSADQPERLGLDTVPPWATGVTGLACVLFHQHDDHLEGLRQMLVKGELAGDGTFRVLGVVTANGRQDTDQMPHAGAPLHMLAFLRLGRRVSKEYLRKRGKPWPPIPFDEIGRRVAEHNARRS
jgi:hypothetical protein